MWLFHSFRSPALTPLLPPPEWSRSSRKALQNEFVCFSFHFHAGAFQKTEALQASLRHILYFQLLFHILSGCNPSKPAALNSDRMSHTHGTQYLGYCYIFQENLWAFFPLLHFSSWRLFSFLSDHWILNLQLTIHDIPCHKGKNPHHHTKIPVTDVPSTVHSWKVIFLPRAASEAWTEMQHFCSVNKSTAMPDMQDYPATGHPIAVHSAPYGFSHMWKTVYPA